MGYQAYIYEWPESQECSECEHHEMIQPHKSNVWTGYKVVCHLNHNKTKEDHCSLFTLEGEETTNPNP